MTVSFTIPVVVLYLLLVTIVTAAHITLCWVLWRFLIDPRVTRWLRKKFGSPP